MRKRIVVHADSSDTTELMHCTATGLVGSYSTAAGTRAATTGLLPKAECRACGQARQNSFCSNQDSHSCRFSSFLTVESRHSLHSREHQHKQCLVAFMLAWWPFLHGMLCSCTAVCFNCDVQLAVRQTLQQALQSMHVLVFLLV